MESDSPSPRRESIDAALERLLRSVTFQGAERSKQLLRFVVDETVADRADRLKEYTLGAEGLGKGDSFDPRSDPIVRAEASRLRARLERYYTTEGQHDPVVIALPKGSYVPQFRERIPSPDRPAQPLVAVMSLRPVWLSLSFLVAGLALGAATLTWWTAHRTTSVERPLAQFEVELTTNGNLGSEVGTDVALSPDGTRIVLIARGNDGTPRLQTRRLDEPSARELPGTDGARSPFFSPDGLWIGFWAAGSVKKTAVDGGSAVVLCEAADLLGGSWGDDGSLIAAVSSGKLARVPAGGGTPMVIADLTSESIDPRWPQLLPGAKDVLFTAVGPQGPDGANIEALSLSDGTRKVLVRGGTYGRYLGNGHLIYVNQGTLFAVRFDLERMQVAPGTPTPLLDDVLYSFTFGFAHLDVSRTGTLVYRKSTARGQSVVEWIDRSGRIESLLATPGQYIFPTLSRDGRRLALAVTEGGQANVAIYERQADVLSRASTIPGDYVPLWSPGGRVLMLGNRSGLYSVTPDDASPPKAWSHGHRYEVPWSFTPDGKRLAYHRYGNATGFDLWTVPIRMTDDEIAPDTPELFLQTSAYETYPAFSPDGHWLAYGSGAYGKWEVYVRRFPSDGSSPVQVSQAGGRIARWLPNGHELMYRTDDQRLMIVTYVVRAGMFLADKPRPWWSGQLADTGVLSNFDLDREGARVVALVPAPSTQGRQSPNHATVVLNFSDEVRRRVELATVRGRR